MEINVWYVQCIDRSLLLVLFDHALYLQIIAVVRV